MDFVAVMLFTQLANHFDCLFFLFFLMLEIVIIWDQTSGWCCLLNACSNVFSSCKNGEIICHMSLFLCLSGISLERHCQKKLSKARGSENR